MGVFFPGVFSDVGKKIDMEEKAQIDGKECCLRRFTRKM
jgi:hypothetical protein